MNTTYYSVKTGKALFSAKITEENGDFTEYLTIAGYEYIRHRQCWVNKKIGIECVIWED